MRIPAVPAKPWSWPATFFLDSVGEEAVELLVFEAWGRISGLLCLSDVGDERFFTLTGVGVVVPDTASLALLLLEVSAELAIVVVVVTGTDGVGVRTEVCVTDPVRVE